MSNELKAATRGRRSRFSIHRSRLALLWACVTALLGATSGNSWADVSGSFLSASAPSTIVVGAPLTVTVEFMNTGTEPFSEYAFIATRFSWAPSAVSRYGFGGNGNTVWEGETVAREATTKSEKLPTRPGTYSFTINAYHSGDFDVDSEQPWEKTGTLMTGSPKTVRFTIVAIPKLTVVGGGIDGEDGNWAWVLPGAERAVFANEPATGKVFDKWTVAPATADLGSSFNPRDGSPTLNMPTVNVTLTAVFIPIPKLTVVGGGIEGEEGNWALVLPGEEPAVFANEPPEDTFFEKWTVAPATVNLGESFNPRDGSPTLIMPSVNVTLTAVYISAPGDLYVGVDGNLPEAELSGIFWAVDSTTWAPANTSGPLKPGTYTVSFKSTSVRWLAPAKQTVTVVSGEGSEVSAVATYVPIVSWQISEASEPGSGTVTLAPANGQVLPGKSVTLTAKPASGFVFVGWESLEKLKGMAPGAERNPTLTVAPASDTLYTARFRATSDCEVPVIELGDPTECRVGVTYHAVIGVNDEALPVTFSATSLPAGLKLDPLTGVISGVPTGRTTVDVTIGAKNVAGSAPPQTYTFEVGSLPLWAQGTFNGQVYISRYDPATKTKGTDLPGEMITYPGTASLSVTAQGKITGKLICGGATYPIAAASYFPMEEEGFDVLGFQAEAKAGTVSIPLSFSVHEAETVKSLAPHFLGVAEGSGEGATASCEAQLYRTVWTDTDMSVVLADYIGYYTAVLPGVGTSKSDGYGRGYLTLTVDPAGAVRTAGKLADGTALSLSGTLIVDGTGSVFTVLYTAPTAYKGGCLFGFVDFVKPEKGPVFLRLNDDRGGILWENLNPQATAEYGVGFERGLSVVGGWYDKLRNLRAYYENGIVVGGVELPELVASVKTTDWNDEQTRRVSSTEMGSFAAAATAPSGEAESIVLNVTPATGVGTGLSAPRADSPVKDPETGDYDYAADTNADGVSNTGALTIAFARATGLLSGSFNLYYDYVSAVDNTAADPDRAETRSHVAKKVSYEGALTPVIDPDDAGLAGGGFFLWPFKAEYLNAQEKLVFYTLNESYDFVLEVP